MESQFESFSASFRILTEIWFPLVFIEPKDTSIFITVYQRYILEAKCVGHSYLHICYRWDV